jgi:hypothetical protein
MVAPSQPLIGKASKDKDVMGALRQKKTGKKAENVKLNSQQIIEASVKAEAPNLDVAKVIQGLNLMANRKMIKFVQIGNTVFTLRDVSPGVAEFHTFTVEPVPTLIKRYRTAMNTAKEMGYKKLVSYSTSPAFNKIAQETGLPVKINQSQQMVNGKAVPAYQYEVTI